MFYSLVFVTNIRSFFLMQNSNILKRKCDWSRLNEEDKKPHFRKSRYYRRWRMYPSVL